MAWFHDDWCRRKSHVITQQAGAGVNYQVPIKVYKGVGVDGTEVYHDVTMGKVYCGGNCQDDFGDIRFTSDDETTELDYWMHDDISSGVYAVFWVKVSGDLTAGNVTIYIYYDTDDVKTTTENMANTFLLSIDDQETAIDALPAGLLDVSTGGCGGTPLIKNDQFKYGGKSLKLTDSCSDGVSAVENTPVTRPFGNYCVLDCYVRQLNCNFYAYVIVSNASAMAIIYLDHGLDDFSYLDGIATYHTLMTMNDNQWYHIQVYYDWVAERYIGMYIDGVWQAGNWTMRDPAACDLGLMVDQTVNIIGRAWFDCLFFRKYVSNVQGNDPAHGAWGEEESPVQPAPPENPTGLQARCICLD